MEITYRNDRHHVVRIRINIYPLLKSESLSVGTELTLYKELMRSIMIYASPAWEFTAES
jgi:hypothetical protein